MFCCLFEWKEEVCDFSHHKANLSLAVFTPKLICISNSLLDKR